MSDLQVERILADARLSSEILAQITGRGYGRESLESNVSPAVRLRRLLREQPGLEKIVRATGRPVLAVRNDTFEAATIRRWQERLETARPLLDKAIRSVGRVELRNDPDYKWAGTAWVVGERLVVTNRHVAEIFARRQGATLVFRRKGGGRLVEASIDFKREHESDATFVIEVDGLVYLAPDDDDAPDVAVLRLASSAGSPPSIELSAEEPGEGREVAVIGYPAYDYDEDSQLQDDIFRFYEVKRLAPGEVMASGNDVVLTHDCSTLGGNSGSVVLDLKTGQGLGLHYSGRSGVANYAVRASVLRAILDGVSQPLTVVSQPDRGEAAKPRVHAPADLAGRSGYDPHFLGVEVPVPQPTGDTAGDLASVYDDGGGLLHYTHFSVGMSRSRRLARFTAVNIDGRDLRRIVRKGDTWFLDGRLPTDSQVGDDVYAKNKLDRGHLVRRLDPVWGEDAARADDDTFHFTNACPQHEGLNQKTWLALEDYILENAGAHDLRVSVFTGPVFRATDRDYRGIQVPEEYWKVVVMRREPEGELLATAYLLTQRHLLTDIEFVFGPFRTYQVPVATVETLTSLDFGRLREHDPLAGSREARGRNARPIEGPEDLVLGGRAPSEDRPAIGTTLAALKRALEFAELIALADRDGVFDSGDASNRKIACQGLIELKQFDRAIAELEKTRAFLRARLEAPKSEGIAEDTFQRLQDRFELAEVEGLLGRVYKQRMVDNREGDAAERASDARQSLKFYYDAYSAARVENLWHGINYVAVAHFGRRRLGLEPPCGAPEDVAREILRTLGYLELRGLLTDWDYATRGEAALSIGNLAMASESYAAYLTRAGDDQFMRNSPLRQLRELWELPPTHPLFALFNGANGNGGGNPAPASGTGTLQARTGGNGYESVDESERQAQLHARSVVRISEDPWVGEGTGFVIDGAEISHKLAGKRLVLTCAHVCPDDVTPDRVTIIFFGAQKRDHVIVQYAEVIWKSPVHELDASLLMLRGGADDAKPAPIAKVAVQKNDDAYIVGHPLGGAKLVSRGKVTDVTNKRFSYGTVTDPGSSGSPVFNGQWELTGLHRAGNVTANEGGRLDEIFKALRRERW